MAAAARWADASARRSSSTSSCSSSSAPVMAAASTSAIWNSRISASRARRPASPPSPSASRSSPANRVRAAVSGPVSIDPNASRARRWASGTTRARCWCCPWSSMSPAADSARAPTGTIRPSTHALDRPSRATVRARVISSPPSASLNRPSTRASSAPDRTRAGSPRPPSSRLRAPTRRVLPAPVSPVRAVMPGPRPTVTSSITPRSRTWSSTSMRPIVTPTGRPGGTSPAGWRGSPSIRRSPAGPVGRPPGSRR